MGINENKFKKNVQLNMKWLSHHRILLTKRSSWTSSQASRMMPEIFVGLEHNAVVLPTRKIVLVRLKGVFMVENLVFREEHVGETVFQRMTLGVGLQLMTDYR